MSVSPNAAAVPPTNTVAYELLEYPIHQATQSAIDAYVRRPSHAMVLAGPAGHATPNLLYMIAAHVLHLPPAQLHESAYVTELSLEKNAIPIEQVRALHTFLSRSVPGKQTIKRVVCIPSIELMTIPAQNALLKLLEEPPSDTVFLATTSAAHLLLPTIVSRMRVVQIMRPRQADTCKYYVQKGYNQAAVERAWLLTDGNPQEMAVLLGDDSAHAVMELVRSALASSVFERLLLVESELKDKDSAKEFSRLLLRTANAALRSSSQKSPDDARRWHRTATAAYTACEALQKNAQTKLVLTELMLAL